MPLRLNVGVSKKLGLPAYSSVGASCNLEVELDDGPAPTTWPAFHEQVRDAYIAVHQAVNDELARLQAQADRSPGLSRSPRSSTATGTTAPPPTAGPPTGPSPRDLGRQARHAQPGPGDRHDRPPPARRPRRPALRARRHPPRGTLARRGLEADRPAQGRRRGLTATARTLAEIHVSQSHTRGGAPCPD